MNQKDIDALFEAVKCSDEKKMEKLGSAAAASLSEEQKNAVEKALSDPDYLKSILSSQKAQDIMKRLHGGK